MNKKAGIKRERENERQRERRAEHQEQWKSDPTCKEFIKLFVHTTGARFTANLRLLDQYVGTALYTRVEEEVERDINEFIAVPPDTHARCRREFFKAMDINMRVCGACGSRDPCSEKKKGNRALDISAVLLMV